eukprot:Rhum_TRINITY_DN21012_c0_g1::Rhum_TRINITY_DN21012_c0_g1_i1::g.172909::m.172909
MSHTGRVVKWVEQTGQGILSRDDGGENLLVYRNGCDGGSLVVGAAVTFDVKANEKARDGSVIAVGVSGEGRTERGCAGDVKIALRTAATPQPDTEYEGVVAQWNELIGHGIVKCAKFSITVPRSALVSGQCLVVGRNVLAEVDVAQGENKSGLYTASRVQGPAVVAEGQLPDSQMPTLKGTKKGTVLKWSSLKGEGILSWDGGEDVSVSSSTFNLSVGTLVEYEIEQEAGRLKAVNVKGVGVTAKANRAVSSRLKSMKFMSRNEDAAEKEAVLKAQALRDATDRSRQDKLRETGIADEIRVSTDDSFPIHYHMRGRRTFGQVDKPQPQLALPPTDPTKKPGAGRYHMKAAEDYDRPRPSTGREQEYFGGKGGKGGRGKGKGGKGGGGVKRPRQEAGLVVEGLEGSLGDASGPPRPTRRRTE